MQVVTLIAILPTILFLIRFHHIDSFLSFVTGMNTSALISEEFNIRRRRREEYQREFQMLAARGLSPDEVKRMWLEIAETDPRNFRRN